MSTKAQVRTQAKTPAAPAAARIPHPPAAEPEHEAERPDIAAQLEGAARLGHSLGAIGVDGSGPPIIQRQVLPEEEEEELQLKREPAAVQRQEMPEEEEEELMLKPEEGRVGPQGGEVPPDLEAAIRRARGGGQPLEGALQEQMSASLGHDFSRVRVHTDSEADELSQQLQAKAFTTGPDIFFKRGAYHPDSSVGRQLIGHELTHVVQQALGRAGRGVSGMLVRSPGDTFEQEAEALARQSSSNRKVAGCDTEGAPRQAIAAQSGARGEAGRQEGPGIAGAGQLDEGGLNGATRRGKLRAARGGSLRARGGAHGGGTSDGMGTWARPVIQRKVDNPEDLRPANIIAIHEGNFRVVPQAGVSATVNDDSVMRLVKYKDPSLEGIPRYNRLLLCSQAVGLADRGLSVETAMKTFDDARVIWRRWLWGLLQAAPTNAVKATEPGSVIAFREGNFTRHVGVHVGGGRVAGYNQQRYVAGGKPQGEYNVGEPLKTADEVAVWEGD